MNFICKMWVRKVIPQIFAISKVEKRIKSTPPFLELDRNDG